MNCGCKVEKSWGDKINQFFKNYPTPWGVDDSGATQYIVDSKGYDIFAISGDEEDIVALVQYINFQATPGH